MKRIILLFTGFILNLGSISAQTITVSQGTIPTIDGTISAGEWADAAVITFSVPPTGSVSCYLKHNGTDKLYIAINIPSFTGYSDQGVLFFDTQNNGGASPQADDYSINAYYSTNYPWEQRGTGSGWNNMTVSEWTEGHTYGGSGNAGIIEYSVSFSKLGITAGINKILGFIAGCGENPINGAGNWWYWPSSANYMNPNTWGDVMIDFTTSSITDNLNKFNESINLYPNPARDNVEIELPQNANIAIMNTQGQIIINNNTTDVKTKLDLENLVSGVYFVRITMDKGITIKKLIKQ